MKRAFFIIAALIIALNSFSQIREIPKEIKENFSKKYPEAKNVDYYDDLVNVNVRFTIHDVKYDAEYSNKGIWKRTEKNSEFDSLPGAVMDGFNKSRYADREVKEVKVVYYPGDIIQYRIKTEKNSVEKKYLYFNAEGRLLRESLTI